MSVTVHFSCSGCDATTSAICRTWCRPLGHGSDLFNVVKPSIEQLAPIGWVAFDPYTYVTYCPDCWQQAMNKTQAKPPLGPAVGE